MVRPRLVSSVFVLVSLVACASQPSGSNESLDSKRAATNSDVAQTLAPNSVTGPAVQAAAAKQDPLAELRKEGARAFEAKDWPNAAELYGRIVEAEPRNAGAWFRRGFALHAQKDFDGSVKAFERSNSITPNATVAYDVACAKAQLGDVDGALDWLDKSAALGLTDLASLSMDADLASLRSLPRFQAVLQRVQDAVQPCEYSPEARQLDYWIGEWDVTAPNGKHVGDSRIDKILDGCVLLENWTGAAGGTGKSFNVYDAAAKCWKQTWVDNVGTVTEYTDGLYADKALVYHAETAAPNGGGRMLLRLTFFDLGPDAVRQFSEQSTDAGKTWTTQYDFHYQRKGTHD